MKTANHKKVISRRNAGLGDNLLATAHAWYYASKTNSSLEINWAPSMYFKDKSVNSFGRFFKVPENIGNVAIIYKPNISFIKRFLRRIPFYPLRYFPGTVISEVISKLMRNKTPSFLIDYRNRRRQWCIDLIKSGRMVKANSLVFNNHFNFLDKETKPFFDALVLRDEYQQKIDRFTETFFTNKTVIGVHVRYYDPSLPYSNHTKYWLNPEESLKTICKKIEDLKFIEGKSNAVIYLATDSEIVYSYIHKKIPDVVSYRKDFQKVTFTLGLHHVLEENSYENDLIEMFLLAKTDMLYRFPPSKSWFSYYASIYVNEVSD